MPSRLSARGMAQPVIRDHFDTIVAEGRKLDQNSDGPHQLTRSCERVRYSLHYAAAYRRSCAAIVSKNECFVRHSLTFSL
jgi:hypothetical protein